MSEEQPGKKPDTGDAALDERLAREWGLRSDDRAPAADAEALGVRVAEALLAQGAAGILASIYGEPDAP